MAVWWVDWDNGDDDSGDGSQTNPWATITEACSSSSAVTAGDEVRVAKSPDKTLLDGTLTWVEGSDTVATSEDLSSVLTAGDYIGKDTDTEAWWEVESVSSSEIVLTYDYYGASETASAKLLGITDTGTAASSTTAVQSINTSGTEDAPLVISGGWDLSSGEQTGITVFKNTTEYGLRLSGYGTNDNIHRSQLLRVFLFLM